MLRNAFLDFSNCTYTRKEGNWCFCLWLMVAMCTRTACQWGTDAIIWKTSKDPSPTAKPCNIPSSDCWSGLLWANNGVTQEGSASEVKARKENWKPCPRRCFSATLPVFLIWMLTLFQVTETRSGPLGCSSYDNLDSVSSILLQSPESKLHLQGKQVLRVLDALHSLANHLNEGDGHCWEVFFVNKSDLRLHSCQCLWQKLGLR